MWVHIFLRVPFPVRKTTILLVVPLYGLAFGSRLAECHGRERARGQGGLPPCSEEESPAPTGERTSGGRVTWVYFFWRFFWRWLPFGGVLEGRLKLNQRPKGYQAPLPGRHEFGLETPTSERLTKGGLVCDPGPDPSPEDSRQPCGCVSKLAGCPS